MNIITTYEYSDVPYSAIIGEMDDANTLEKINELEALFADKEGSVELKRESIRFKNFVGIVKVNDVFIEVLPKIYQLEEEYAHFINKHEIYKNLNYMINKSLKLSIKNIEVTNYAGKNEGMFLDFFINMFLQELYSSLFKGMYKTYVSHQENLNYLRGRLLVAENIKYNVIHNRMFCEFDEFTEDNLVNQVFKYTVNMMAKMTGWQQNKQLAENIVHLFNEVSDVYVTAETCASIKEDRLLVNYLPLLAMAKMFLAGQSFDIESPNGLANFIFTVDMNVVYQEYIVELLNEYKADIFNASTQIKAQYSKTHLIYDEQDKGRFLLKPDIAVLQQNELFMIIDTKYKKLNPKKYRNGVSDKDLYQMFGYYHKYDKPSIVLLYPSYGDEVRGQYKFEKYEEPSMFVCTVSLANQLYTKEGENFVVQSLKEILNK